MGTRTVCAARVVSNELKVVDRDVLQVSLIIPAWCKGERGHPCHSKRGGGGRLSGARGACRRDPRAHPHTAFGVRGSEASILGLACHHRGRPHGVTYRLRFYPLVGREMSPGAAASMSGSAIASSRSRRRWTGATVIVGSTTATRVNGRCQIYQETGTLISTLRFAARAEDGICMQVSQGNDTDSYGATAGSLLGAVRPRAGAAMAGAR